MGQLVGLGGVRGPLLCQHVVTVDHALRRIQKRRAVTAAGANGALNVWRDDKRRLRSCFCRYLVTIDEAEHENLDSLKRWLERWWPELGRDSDAEVGEAEGAPAPQRDEQQ